MSFVSREATQPLVERFQNAEGVVLRDEGMQSAPVLKARTRRALVCMIEKRFVSEVMVVRLRC